MREERSAKKGVGEELYGIMADFWRHLCPFLSQRDRHRFSTLRCIPGII